MPMPPYPVHCYTKGCPELAAFKVAARWSDGVRAELKTYTLCCERCLPDWFRRSRDKQAAYRAAAGEATEPPGIYALSRGQRDQQLERLAERERELQGE